MFKKISVIAGFVLLMAMLAALVFEFDGKSRRQTETITILRGQNMLQIINDLKAEGYINSKVFFLLEMAKSGNLRNLKSGEYDLAGLDNAQIIDKMANARTVARTATIIPGWTLQDIQNDPAIKKILKSDNLAAADIAALKENFDFLRGLPADADLEGYMFPDTYQLPEDPKIGDLIAAALKNFDKKLSLDAREKIAGQNKTIHDVAIMASILEKEVKTLEDKKIVAGILWKRLAAGMPLQADATLLYHKAGGNDVFNKELDSPYNTYKYPGLPIGPICNPGAKSFEAAIEPIETSYWYYLSATDGATIFSKTHDEHRKNIAKYLK